MVLNDFTSFEIFILLQAIDYCRKENRYSKYVLKDIEDIEKKLVAHYDKLNK